MKKVFLFAASLFICFGGEAGNKIKYYFNQPVDTSVATFEKAIYLNTCSADTLTAYLKRAKYSLDICIYDFEKTYSYNISTVDTTFAPEVAAAINNAYARGVKVRIIYEASNANTGLSLLDSGIHTLGSPQGHNYTIMHNKFVVIDAASPDNNDPVVWTGCMNWYYEQFNWDFNNIVVLQDSALASAYTAEFNMMWGDTGINPNLTASKFGQFKTDLGLHNFTIDGNHIELYFSPSDHTDTHIQSTIETANTDLYFGMYDFTEVTDANDIIIRSDSGVYVAGIGDSYTVGYYPAILNTLGSKFKIYNGTDTTLYHNKFMIVDPSDTCSDPIVLTGSHNWTSSANTKNDENTLIIHNDTAANLYLQYFKATFNSLGGTLAPQKGCRTSDSNTSVKTIYENDFSARIYPSPSTGNITISCQLPSACNVNFEIVNELGQTVKTIGDHYVQQPGKYSVASFIDMPGVYVAKITAGNNVIYKRFIIARM